MDQEPLNLQPASPFGSNIDLAENPEPRVPCCLILDVSGSMEGDPINQLNAGLQSFKMDLESDPLAIKRVEVMIVSFGDRVNVLTDFQTVDHFTPPVLSAAGLTPMGQAVSIAMEKMGRRKEEYKQNGVAYYRPWIFLITDGAPNDTGWEDAALRAKQEDAKKSFAMFCVGVQGANMEVLRKFTNRDPLLLDGLRFRDLFLWLSRSMKSVSRSTPGENVPLTDPTAPKGWASV
jgi:uncharacterized protein YegL